MKKLVITLSAIALTSCGTSKKPTFQQQIDEFEKLYSTNFISSCSYPGIGIQLKDMRSLFTDDIKKSEYETQEQYYSRLKLKVPEYITAESKVTYTHYNAENRTLSVPYLSEYGPPIGTQWSDLIAETNINRQKKLDGTSYPRIKITDQIPYSTKMVGETAWGYQKEITAAKFEEYYISIGKLESKLSPASRKKLKANIPMTPVEAQNSKDSLYFEFTIKTSAPYLLTQDKDTIRATISSPITVARSKYIIVGEYCSGRFINKKTGKIYNYIPQWSAF